MVEATGLEPAASWSQTKHSTKLSYASIVDVTAQRNSSKQCALMTVCYRQVLPASSNSFYIITYHSPFVNIFLNYFDTEYFSFLTGQALFPPSRFLPYRKQAFYSESCFFSFSGCSTTSSSTKGTFCRVFSSIYSRST